MANVTPEEDRKDLEVRLKHGRRLNGHVFVGNDRSRAYNVIHGTHVIDNSALDALKEKSNE